MGENLNLHMSKKYFVIADVHSFYDEFRAALAKCGWEDLNPEHILISCGDLFDRGPKPLECLQFIMSLPEERRILIKGNHEDLLEECLLRQKYLEHDIHNGTDKTIKLLAHLENVNDVVLETNAVKNNPIWQAYINSCVDYAEIGNNIFVHGWIPVKTAKPQDFFDLLHPKYKRDTNWRHASKTAWKNARWLNGMRLWSEGIKIKNKTIYCGHWHCSYGHAILHKEGVEFPSQEVNGSIADFSPFYDEGIIALDACTAISHMVNCIVIEED